MKAQLKAVLENTIINFELQGAVACPWSESDKVHQYSIELVKNGKQVIKTNFFDSILNFRMAVNGDLQEKDDLMIDAFYSILSDGLCYSSSIDLNDFIIEMCYLSKDDLKIVHSILLDMDDALLYDFDHESFITAYNDAVMAYTACKRSYEALAFNYDINSIIKLFEDY